MSSPSLCSCQGSRWTFCDGFVVHSCCATQIFSFINDMILYEIRSLCQKKMNLTASFDGKDIGFIDNERTRLWWFIFKAKMFMTITKQNLLERVYFICFLYSLFNNTNWILSCFGACIRRLKLLRTDVAVVASSSSSSSSSSLLFIVRRLSRQCTNKLRPAMHYRVDVKNTIIAHKDEF